MTRQGQHRGCQLPFHAIGCPDWKPDDNRTWQEWDDQFFKGRVAEWRRRCENGGTVTLVTYLGMTRDEYGEWFLTGFVPDRVNRVWGRGTAA